MFYFSIVNYFVFFYVQNTVSFNVNVVSFVIFELNLVSEVKFSVHFIVVLIVKIESKEKLT